MEFLQPEIVVLIFQHIRFPSALFTTNRHWNISINNPHAKAAWLITQHGKAHALFHAVRLGRCIFNFN